MDINSFKNSILDDETKFYELKGDMEEVLKTLSDPKLFEFRQEFIKTLKAVEQNFQNMSMIQRNFVDQHDKFKKSNTTKHEKTKEVFDEEEKLMNLKQEYENIYQKIDDKKFEEMEKEKEIRSLNEEIIRLRTRLDVENISNFKPQEIESQNKLISELDDIETRILSLEERKMVEFARSAKLTQEKFSADSYGQQLSNENSSLESIKKKLEEESTNEKNAKLKIEKELLEFKENNSQLKSSIKDLESKLKESKENCEKEQRTLDNMSNSNKNKQKEIDNTKKKNLEIEERINENEFKKIKEITDFIKEKTKERKEKQKEIRKLEEESESFHKQIQISESKINEIEKEILILNEEKKELKNKTKELEKEIDAKRTTWTQRKNDLYKSLKGKDEKIKELDKLQKKFDDNVNYHKSIRNSNQRLQNETSGIKREIDQLEQDKASVEREKNMYAKQASDANMEYTQSLERLKNLDEAINELKTKNNQADTKLKQQKKIYEALRADCNRFAKKYQDAQTEIKEIIDDNTKKQQNYQNLKLDLGTKQNKYQHTLEALEREKDEYKQNMNEKTSLEKQKISTKISFDKYVEMNSNLKKTIATAEQDLLKQDKEHKKVIAEKVFMDQQLIKRNDEIQSLYEKIKVLQSEISKMHSQYVKKELDLAKAKAEIEFLFEEFAKSEKIIVNINGLKITKIKLEKELLITKNKVRSLEDENRKPMNIHRWRKLEYSDPEKFELITQINSLQKRLIAKTEEVGQKEDLIQEKEKLYIKLKTIVARQSGVDMAEALKNYKKIIMEKSSALKNLVEEIKTHQSTIRIHQVENKRLDEELNQLKNQWFDKVKSNNKEASKMNEMIENQNEEDGENNDSAEAIEEMGYTEQNFMQENKKINSA